MHPAVARLCETHLGGPPERVERLAGDGGRRRMVRVVRGDAHAVAVLGPDARENRAFLAFTRVFRGLGLPVPEILAADEAEGAYLLEDLGDTTLFDALSREGFETGRRLPHSLVSVYREILDHLVRFQVEGGERIEFRLAQPRAAFDRRAYLWDLSSFKYQFLRLAGVPFDEDVLQDDFERLTDQLLDAPGGHFVYRDLQSTNVMLVEGRPRFIDYQGGRRGPLEYDVASLLFDAKARLSPALRRALLEHYLARLEAIGREEAPGFRERLPGFVLVRILQALGAYGLRGFYERKPRFLASVALRIAQIEELFLHGPMPLEAPELCRVLERLAASETLRSSMAPADSDALVVRIGSFSYKRGIPDDPGGHGGGYVFDCRGLANPGRDSTFANQTGQDSDVVRHLEQHPEVHTFYERARDLIESHLAVWQARGFTSLSVFFGCTGGQHRSVYMAERLARHLRERHVGLSVTVSHAEAPRWPTPGTKDVPWTE